MLIEDIKTLAKYIPSIVNVTDFSLFENDLQIAEDLLKYKYLGVAIYDKIDTDDALRAYCTRFVAYKAAVEFIPQIDLLLTDSGFVVTNNSNQSPASKERIERLINACKDKASVTLERLYTYLEKQDNYYEDWKSAPLCSRFDDKLCNTNELFTVYAIGWEGNIQDFIKLRPKMIEVTDSFILPKIGLAFYSYILQNPEDGKIKAFIHQLCGAYAAAVMGDRQRASRAILHVMHYLIENKEEYPEFDSYYQEPDRWQNSDENKIVALGI